DSMNVGENVAFDLIENCKFPDTKIKESVTEKLKLVGLEGSEMKMPSELSGGMKKRVALARALVCEPELLLYDEPTTGLDPIMSTTIEDLIKQLHKTINITSILVTHQQTTIVRSSDKIYFLKDGAIRLIGNPENLRMSHEKELRKFAVIEG
ncbi:ABC transporter ATP-binding protein, partial [Candidatus Margulisiibacteriota bacterium]